MTYDAKIQEIKNGLILVREIYDIYHESWAKAKIQELEEELKKLEERK